MEESCLVFVRICYFLVRGSDLWKCCKIVCLIRGVIYLVVCLFSDIGVMISIL